MGSDDYAPDRDRRGFLHGVAGASALGLGLAFAAPAARAASAGHGKGRLPASGAASNLTPKAALGRLKSGNALWAARKSKYPDQDAARRKSVVGGQNPFAVVFSCIDSRVPPELLFDQGLGDLFVLRTAAHTLDGLIEGSVEYGPLELGTPLIVVLGHEKCGAITAAVDAIENGTKLPGHLPTIVEAVKPAYTTNSTVEATTKEYTHQIVAKLQESAALAPRISDGKLEIVPAYYNLASSSVSWI